MTDTFTIRATITRKGLKNLTVAEAVQAYNSLMDGDARDQQLARTIIRTFPNLPNYDYNGNYIGSVSGENGWTA